MLEPYRMVIVNVIASILLGAGLLVYIYIYPQKKPKLFPLLLIISLLPLISILRKGTYESGDLSLHAKFAMQFFDNLQQGNFSPEWIGRHCSGYGCPLYIFIFPLPYYFISFFHWLGFSFIASVKALIICSYIVSGIGMYLWIKNELDEKAAFVASIFYLYAPYHLIDLHFRVSIGELLSMALLPYLFLLIKKIVETLRPIYFVMNAFLFALLILSHQVTTLASLPLVFIYGLLVLWRKKQKKLLRLSMMSLSLFLGILLASFYWIPVLVEGKDTYYKLTNSIAFHPLSSFLYSPNRFGLLFQGHFGEYYLNVGYVQWLVIGYCIYLLWKKKVQGKEKILLTFCLVTFAVLFFMMQSVSKPIWDSVSLLKSFQFSWRLLIEEMIMVSVMAAIIAKKINRNFFIIILCTVTILYTILNWGNRKTLPDINDTILRGQNIFDEHQGPGGVDLTTPKWVDEYKPWIGKKPQYTIETLSGNATFKTLNHSIIKHEYTIKVTNNALIKENTYYYPGWIVTANGKDLPILFNNKNYPGVITFHLKKGTYHVSLFFTDTFDRKIAKVISIITFIILSIYLFSYVVMKKKFTVVFER